MMRNIVLIGFMGTGKTTIGRLLAKRLARPFVDSDRKIEQQCKMSISDMFSLYGESYFREKERDVIAKLARYRHAVIATGGGVVLASENVLRLKRNGVLIALTASVDVILERTSRRHNRPLLEAEERESKIVRLLKERELLYRQADITIDTSDKSPQEIIEMILVFLREGGYLRGRN